MSPPAWIAPQEQIHHPDYNKELTQFLPCTIMLKKPPGAQLCGPRFGRPQGRAPGGRSGAAVEILKTAREILTTVRFFPYNYQRPKERTVD
ncbi:hypothetical protein J4Q44_G00303840 [Coregonus suidteri]|uniref:Uncharacterized protein n=1 Tax=Coregonus suidteri TaxID=861788 RepID=A0AAN8L0V4_9TELE